VEKNTVYRTCLDHHNRNDTKQASSTRRATMSAEALLIEDRTNDSINILLGVTGSVAAVKVPELISRLLDRFGTKISIKVVLTQGGKNFWEKASTYDAAHWNKVQHLLEHAFESKERDETMTKSKIQIYCKCFSSYLVSR
jgi:Flavoprotein